VATSGSLTSTSGGPSSGGASGLSTTPHSDPSSLEHQRWLDPEEVVIRKRLPQAFPKRHVDIYITNKTHPKVQLDRVHHLINSGESDVYLHALGAAIPRALNLALKVKKYYGEQVSLDTATNTVELTDDFERIVQNTEDSQHLQQRTRLNSGVYVKITHVPVVAGSSNDSSGTTSSNGGGEASGGAGAALPASEQ